MYTILKNWRISPEIHKVIQLQNWNIFEKCSSIVFLKFIFHNYFKLEKAIRPIFQLESCSKFQFVRNSIKLSANGHNSKLIRWTFFPSQASTDIPIQFLVKIHSKLIWDQTKYLFASEVPIQKGYSGQFRLCETEYVNVI